MGALIHVVWNLSPVLTLSLSSISLWSTQKKKPIFTQPLAHGLDEMESSTEGTIRTPRWITSLGSLRYSNIFASGGSNLLSSMFLAQRSFQVHGMDQFGYGSWTPNSNPSLPLAPCQRRELSTLCNSFLRLKNSSRVRHGLQDPPILQLTLQPIRSSSLHP